MDNPLYVDDRAGSIDLVRYEPLLSSAELVRLDSGDCMFAGNGPTGAVIVGIEVKSIYDLISSMNTGRLQATQLPALVAQYDVRWLLIYGPYGPGPGGQLQVRNGKYSRDYRLGSRKVPYGYVEAFLCEVVELGVNVKNVPDAHAAAQWIGVLHRWWSKPWDRHRGMRGFDKSGAVGLIPGMDGDTQFRARVASQFPGVGFERAIAAATHFSSVEAMVGASAADWEAIPGIGKVIAKAIVAAVRK